MGANIPIPDVLAAWFAGKSRRLRDLGSESGVPGTTVRWPHHVAEILAIFLVFFLFAGWPAPDVNEAHYLTKAKHLWQPDWCPGDLFLNSANAHPVFFRTFGWVTSVASLSAASWIGRVVGWVMLAAAWQRLSWAWLPRFGTGLLSSGLFLVLLTHGQMSGEWVVGGIEAKVPAYALTFWALARMLQGHWCSALAWAGAAAAFHVLVGGWTLVAMVVCRLTDRVRGYAPATYDGNEDPISRPTRYFRVTIAAMAGSAMVLAGLLPALRLSWQVDPQVAHEACRVYVFERLDHHLVFSSFPVDRIIRHAILFALWVPLAWFSGHRADFRRLRRFVYVAAFLALVAIMVCCLVPNRDMSARVLRFYWFRLEDVALPLGICLVAIRQLERLECNSRALHRGLAVAMWAIAGGGVAAAVIRMGDADIPRADQAWVRRGADSIATRTACFEDWLDVCWWVERNTAPDAVILTPISQQTFKWYAQRSEVVTWKDLPQDLASIHEWWRRVQAVRSWEQAVALYSREPEVSEEAARPLADQLNQLQQRYGFSYVVYDDRERSWSPPYLRVYQNGSFSVYRRSSPRAARNADPFTASAGDKLPPTVHTLLGAQAMFPVTATPR